MNLWLVFLIVLVVVILAGFFIWGIKRALWLAVNSVIGFFALYAVQAFILTELVINIWKVIVVALFGLIGLLIVLVAHLLF